MPTPPPVEYADALPQVRAVFDDIKKTRNVPDVNNCIATHTEAARRAGMSEAMFGELMAVVGMANETNRLANGYRVPIDDALKI
jgi:alkylhydroperoxidase family enzyme